MVLPTRGPRFRNVADRRLPSMNVKGPNREGLSVMGISCVSRLPLSSRNCIFFRMTFPMRTAFALVTMPSDLEEHLFIRLRTARRY